MDLRHSLPAGLTPDWTIGGLSWEYSNIRLDRGNAVATITLNRPDALNALSLELLEEFSCAVDGLAGDETIKALVVRGEGRAFCAGADLLHFDAAFDEPALFNRYVRVLNRCFLQLEELPIPVIAVVQGFALAGGLGADPRLRHGYRRR